MGRILAIKLIQRPWFEFPDSTWLSLKQEVETLGPTSHVSQYFLFTFLGQLMSIAPSRGVCICVVSKRTSGDFRGPERRNLEVLIDRSRLKEDLSSVEALLYQMLQALDILAYNDVLHRDVKPANIFVYLSA